MAHMIFYLLAYFLIVAGVFPPSSYAQSCHKNDFDLILSPEGGSATCRFMSKLADIIVKENPTKNLVISPVSIILALALLEAGAQGETRQKIQEVTADFKDVSENYSKIFQSMQHFLKYGFDEHSELSIANGIFTREISAIKDEYKLIAKTCFEAEVGKLPQGNDEAVEFVNKWVSDKTYDKIPKLFEPGSFDGSTHTVLVNAIYMFSPWKYQFNITEEGQFYAFGKSENEQTVTYARLKGDLETWEKDGYTAIALPYDGDELEMILVKKNDYDANENYEDKKKAILNLFASQREKYSRPVDLSIPKFSFRYKADLEPIFQKLGLDILFSDEADLSKMSVLDSKVDKVVHKAYIKVDEKGTTAAAATGISIRIKSALPQVEVLKFDKPFMFFITHKLTGAQLFAGQVNFIENIE